MKPIPAVIYLALVTGLLLATFGNWSYDDPFITYRYAQNLSAGHGLVYNLGDLNPPDPVLSTTAPFFALILAAGSLAGPDLPRLANWIGALSLAFGGLFLWNLAQSWRFPIAGWAGLVLYPSSPVIVGTLGSETPLALALCLGSFAFYARKRYGLAALMAGLAVLTRWDCLLVPALLGLDFLLHYRLAAPQEKQALRRAGSGAILIFISFLLPWLIFLTLTFGSPIPDTLFVKQQQALLSLSQRFAPGFLSIFGPYFQQAYFWLLSGLGLLGVVWILKDLRRETIPALGAFFFWPAGYFLAYSLLGVSRYFWYYAPLLPGFVMLAGLGIAALTDQAKKSFSNKGTAFQKTLLAILILSLAIGQALHLGQVRAKPDPRMKAYQEAGEWLAVHSPPDAQVGALEVGALGYYAQRTMVDFAGLIQPEIARQFQPGGSYADSARWAIQQYRPDYLVLPGGFFPDFEDGTFQVCQDGDRLNLVHSIKSKSDQFSYDINLYACGKIPPPV
jgi:hypothetical protein